MKKFCEKVKAFFKSGIDKVAAFYKKNKTTILLWTGKFVLYVCKTIIELFLDRLF